MISGNVQALKVYYLILNKAISKYQMDKPPECAKPALDVGYNIRIPRILD